MSQSLVTIASFDHAEDAYAGRSELERRGISAVVVDAMIAANLFKMGGIGASLQVDEEDVERARAVLLGFVSRQSDEDVPKFWRCGSCDEIVEPSFHVCWSCSRPRKEIEDRSFEPTLANVVELSEEKVASGHAPILKLTRRSSDSQGEEQIASLPSNDSLTSYKPAPIVIAPQVDTDESVMRAWRTAIMGLFIFPPLLNTYSMYLLIRVGFSRVKASPKITRRFYGAILVNILAALAVGFYRWFEWLE